MDLFTGGYDALNEITSGGGSFALIVYYILMVIAYWKLFEKAGIPGWLSVIPIVNVYFMFKIAMGHGLLFLLMIIPVVDIILHIIFCLKLSKAYRQGVGFAIGLMLLPPIFALILGLGESQYDGPQ